MENGSSVLCQSFILWKFQSLGFAEVCLDMCEVFCVHYSVLVDVNVRSKCGIFEASYNSYKVRKVDNAVALCILFVASDAISNSNSTVPVAVASSSMSNSATVVPFAVVTFAIA